LVHLKAFPGKRKGVASCLFEFSEPVARKNGKVLDIKKRKMKNSSPKALITISNIRKIKQFYVSIRLVIKTSSLWAVYMGQNFL